MITTDRDDVAAAVDDLRVTRRGHGSLYDIAVPGYKANLSDVLAAIALFQLDKLERHREIRQRRSRRTTRRSRSWTASSRWRATRATPTPPPVRRPDRPRTGRGDAQRLPAGAGEERISTSIHFLPVHRLTRTRPLPGAAGAARRRASGREVLSLPLSPAHPDEDIADAVEALRRVHARFTSDA